MSTSKKHSSAEIGLYGVAWGLVGAIFSGLFIVFLEIFRHLNFELFAEPVAGALAGAVGAAFYGAMQIAMIGALAGVISTVAYVISSGGDNVHPVEILAAAGVAGVVLGAGFGAGDRFLIRGSLAKAVSGMVGGFVAGATAWPFAFFDIAVPIWAITGALVPITGYIYVALVGPMEHRVGGRIPYPVRGGILGGSLAAVIGVTVWAVGGTVTATVGPEVIETIESAGQLLPRGLIGGAVGGIIAGSLIAMLKLTPKG